MKVLFLLTAALGVAQGLREEIVAQERAGLEALKRGNVAAFADALAEDSIFVDSAGLVGKALVKNVESGFQPREFIMSDIRFVELSKESGLIVYAMDESGTSQGKEFTARVHVSAIWTKRSGKWLCQFSQETTAGKAAN